MVFRPDALTAGTLAENGPFCSFPNAGSIQQAYLLERLSLAKNSAQWHFRISMQAFSEFGIWSFTLSMGRKRGGQVRAVA